MNTLTLSQVKAIFNELMTAASKEGVITQAFKQFPAGTKEIVIMHWLEEQNLKFSIADHLMSNDYKEYSKVNDACQVRIIL